VASPRRVGRVDRKTSPQLSSSSHRTTLRFITGTILDVDGDGGAIART